MALLIHVDACDKHRITLTVRAWINAESAIMEAQPVFEREFALEMPDKINGHPIAWAYEQIKAGGLLGETEDC